MLEAPWPCTILCFLFINYDWIYSVRSKKANKNLQQRVPNHSNLINYVEKQYKIIKVLCNWSRWSTSSGVREWLTALFTNMRILKFKSHQLTIAFFAAVNHLNGPLRKQNFILTGSKGHGLWFLIGGFRSVLWVFVFQGSLFVIVIMIDGSEKRYCGGGFWALEFACLWKAQ